MIREQNQSKLLKKSLHYIRSLKQALKESKFHEPIAIISMACRFPGGSSTPEKYWELLKTGREGLCDVPPKRWNNQDFYDEAVKPNKSYVKQANFLSEDISLFDPKLFNISPREAEEIDPQHRLLLEITWELLERAGLSTSQIKGESVGTFIGIISSEYAMLPRDPEKVGPYTMTGTTPHMASGRIAHVFGFRGPALSIDTACSSSLVAIHQACDSLQNKDCQYAIAGGVGLMLTPAVFTGLCQMQALAKDGRCKPFAADGDGYGRGEGAGLILLRRLNDAERDQDPILAIIQGSSTNHDGASSGLTVPNCEAQRELLEQTIRRSGIKSSEVSYLEMHGTGTALGDPIEFQSLTQVFAKDRAKENPLIIGTCKANIGHLEAASGIAGVIKTVLCLQNKAIPPHINCNELNPRMQLENIPAILPKTYRQWDLAEGFSRIAGISSFGFSGTNAHMILKEYTKSKSTNTAKIAKRPMHILTLSAQTEKALFKLVEAYIKFLTISHDVDLASLTFTSNVGRAHFIQRIACVSSNQKDLLSQLTEFYKNKKADSFVYYDTLTTTRIRTAKITAFFPSVIKQIPSLAEFFSDIPYFQQIWKSCEAVFESYLSKPLTDLLVDLHSSSVENSLSNAALSFSLSYCTFQLLQHWGIQIYTIYAEKDGLYTMAAASGLLTLKEAAHRLIYRYVPEQFEETPELHFNMTRLRVILPGKDRPLTSQDLTDLSLLERAYDNTLYPKEVETLLYVENGITIELNNMPDLLEKLYGKSLKSINYSIIFSADSVWKGFTHAIAKCYSLGQDIAWKAFNNSCIQKRILCPTYPFQYGSYWIPQLEKGASLQKISSISSDTPTRSPLIGRVQISPLSTKQIIFNISLANLPDLKDTHNIVHIGYFLELLQLGLNECGITSIQIQSMNFDVVLYVSDSEELEIQLIIENHDDSTRKFSFHSLDKNSKQWTRHVRGVILLLNSLQPKQFRKQSLPSIQKKLQREQSGLVFYQRMQERGISLGASVQWIEKIWSQEGEALSRFRLANEEELPLSFQQNFHPGIWDACSQLFHATLANFAEDGSIFMVTQLGYLMSDQTEVSPILWCHAKSTGKTNKEGLLEGTFTLYNDMGRVVANCKNYQMKALSAIHKEVFTKAGNSSSGKQDETLLNSIRKTQSDVEKLNLIQRHIQAVLSELLKLPLEEVALTESLVKMGMDSLVGLEFKVTLDSDLCIAIPIGILLQATNIEALSIVILRQLNLPLHQESISNADLSPVSQREFSKKYSLNKNKWCHTSAKKQADIRLYCLPYGGGTASIYQAWQNQMPDSIEVVPIQLPGRGDRLLERPIENITELASVLTEIVRSDLGRPYAIYGHSVGALIAYAWALQIQQLNLPLPRHLVVGAFSAPFIPNSYLSTIKAKLQKEGLDRIPSLTELLNSKDNIRINKFYPILNSFQELAFFQDTDDPTMQAFLPMIVADLRLVDTYIFPKQHNQLSIPITALHGEKDDRITLDEMKQWNKLTDGKFDIKSFRGDHFFLNQDQSGKKVTHLIANLIVTQTLII